MLDIKYLKENLKEAKKALSKKHTQFDLEKVIRLYDDKQIMQQKIENLRAQQNQLAKEGKKSTEASKIKDEIKNLQPKLKEAESKFLKEAVLLHNIPDKSVPSKTEGDQVIKKWGKPKEFNFPVKNHAELGETLDIIDVKRAAKVCGSRFAYLKNEAVLLQFALINYIFEKLSKKGFLPMVVPGLVREQAMFGTGFFPTEKKEYFKTEEDDLFLAGTAEVPLCSYRADELINEKDLPLKYAGFSSCFRREAGTYGRDTQGIFRLHQFDKIEMFVFAKPERSEQIFGELININEEICQELELPYQLLNISGGELGAPNAKKIDTEIWFPSQKKYRELTSCSLDTDFQARRLNIKYQAKDGKKEYIHTLNDTALAIGRTIAAIIENYQEKDGSVKIPKALHKYLPFSQIGPK